MNRLLLIGFFWSIVLCSTGAIAKDVLIGHVVSVNREAGEFVLQVTTDEKEFSENITIRKADSEAILFLPECVAPGNFVRIWGSISGDNNRVFHADIVRGSGLGRSDISGIRSRINRGMGQQHNRQSRRLHKNNK